MVFSNPVFSIYLNIRYCIDQCDQDFVSSTFIMQEAYLIFVLGLYARIAKGRDLIVNWLSVKQNVRYPYFFMFIML